MSGEFVGGEVKGLYFELEILGTAFQIKSINSINDRTEKYKGLDEDTVFKKLENDAFKRKYDLFFSKIETLGYKKCKVEVENIQTKKGKKFTILITDTIKRKSYSVQRYTLKEALDFAKKLMYNAKGHIKIDIYTHQKNEKFLIKTLRFKTEGGLLKKPKKNGKTIKYLPINRYLYSVVLIDYEYEYM